MVHRTEDPLTGDEHVPRRRIHPRRLSSLCAKLAPQFLTVLALAALLTHRAMTSSMPNCLLNEAGHLDSVEPATRATRVALMGFREVPLAIDS